MTLIHGDCLAVLRGLSANSIDSLVTDPPAGISFMGKQWDDDKGGRKQWVAWMTEVMQECLRVMKPGAHGLVWALPRTSHWTATALEDAGFEVRDVVTHLFGTGFPKSRDLSKDMDKAVGAKREVIGKKSFTSPNTSGDHNSGTGGWGSGIDKDRPRLQLDVTSPATEAAKQWEGFGTSLKPASEHWILVRKPISEKTVAANVLKWGCGGLNIDASRIKLCNSSVNSATKASNVNPVTLPTSVAKSAMAQIESEDSITRSDGQTQLDTSASSTGMTPSANTSTSSSTPLSGNKRMDQSQMGMSSTTEMNVNPITPSTISNVSPKETTSGTTQASTPTTTNAKLSTQGVGENQGRFPSNLVLDEEAAQALDKQSIANGIHSAGKGRANGSKFDKKKSMFGIGHAAGNSPRYDDGNNPGASRFFYIAKASKSDKGTDNIHPTVKSTKLMEYLIKLVTPPNGIILDPFAGSGTTGVAAKNLGYSFKGIEQEQLYFDIAWKRIHG